MRSILAIVLLMINLGSARAQQAELRADVNKNTIEEGELLRYTITIENGEERNLTPPPFSDFQVISSSRSSQMSVQIVNGRQEVKKTLKITYLIRPSGIGDKVIEAAELRSGNGTLRTRPIHIKVVKSGTLPKRKAPSGADVGGFPKKDIFLRAHLSKKEVYRGEQLVLYYTLYFRSGISNYEMPASKLNGFWSKEIEIKNPEVKTQNINGVNYRTAVVRKLILFPQKSGELVIDPARMTVDVQYSFFDTRRIKLTSNAVKLKVKELPAGAPPEFNGAVGNFRIESTLSSDEAAVNEPLTLRVKISGTGNIQLIDLPEPRLPDDFEVYDPKINEHISTRGDVLSGTKSYEYLLVPRQRGTYKLDSLIFAWFDPATGEYKKAHTRSYEIRVSGEARSNPGGKNAISGLSKEDVELLDQDIRYIHSETKLKRSGLSYFASIRYYVLMLAPGLLFILLLLIRRQRMKAAGSVEQIRQKKAARKALKKLNGLAREELSDKDYFEAIPNILWDYLGERIHLDRSEQTQEGIRRKFESLGIDPLRAEELETLLDNCRAAVYAPSQAGLSRSEMLERARSWINRFEKELQA